MSQRPLSAINEDEVFFDAKSFHPSVPSVPSADEAAHFNAYDYGSLRRIPYEYSSLKRTPRPMSGSINSVNQIAIPQNDYGLNEYCEIGQFDSLSRRKTSKYATVRIPLKRLVVMIYYNKLLKTVGKKLWVFKMLSRKSILTY